MAVAAQPGQARSRRKRSRKWPKVLFSFVLMVILSIGAFAGELQRGEVPEVDGPTVAKETFGRLLDIPIDYYVLIDFEGFVKTVDALGGIDIEVERDLVYHDETDGTRINLKKGFQHLDGEETLGYVRHRLDDRGWRYSSNDFERNERVTPLSASATFSRPNWPGTE